MELTTAQVRRWKRYRHSMLFDGVFKVNSGYRVTGNTQGSPRIKASMKIYSPFRPNMEQTMIVTWRRNCLRDRVPCNTITVKQREIGLTTIGVLLPLSEGFFVNGFSMTTCASDPDVSKNGIHPILDTCLTNLPDEIAPRMKRNVPEKVVFMHGQNNSLGVPKTKGTITGLSATKEEKTGIGTRTTYHLWTEFAHWGNDDEVIKALSACVIPGPLSMVMIESTAHGRHNNHYYWSESAWKDQGKANFWEKGFKEGKSLQRLCLFFPWWFSDKRQLPFLEGVKAKDFLEDLTAYESELYHTKMKPNAENLYKLTGSDVEDFCMRQIHWYRMKSYDLPQTSKRVPIRASSEIKVSTIEALQAEYPSYFEEAFVGTSSGVFQDRHIDEMKRTVREPTHVGYFDGGHFVAAENGLVKLWIRDEWMTSDGRYRGPLASLGFDVAHGDNPQDDKSDFSAAVATVRYEGVLQQVMEYEDRIKVHNYHAFCWEAAKFFQGGREDMWPLVCIESADAGRGIAQEFDEKYPEPLKSYRSQSVERPGEPETRKAGFEPRLAKLDAFAWKEYEILCIEVRLLIRSSRLLDQNESLIRKQSGKVEAARKGTHGKGSKDDVADAAKMSAYHYIQWEKWGGEQPDYEADGEGLAKDADLQVLRAGIDGIEPWWGGDLW